MTANGRLVDIAERCHEDVYTDIRYHFSEIARDALARIYAKRGVPVFVTMTMPPPSERHPGESRGEGMAWAVGSSSWGRLSGLRPA